MDGAAEEGLERLWRSAVAGGGGLLLRSHSRGPVSPPIPPVSPPTSSPLLACRPLLALATHSRSLAHTRARASVGTSLAHARPVRARTRPKQSCERSRGRCDSWRCVSFCCNTRLPLPTAQPYDHKLQVDPPSRLAHSIIGLCVVCLFVCLFVCLLWVAALRVVVGGLCRDHFGISAITKHWDDDRRRLGAGHNHCCSIPVCRS